MLWLFFLRWQSRGKGSQSMFRSSPNKEVGMQQVCIGRDCLNSSSPQFTLLWHQLQQRFQIPSEQSLPKAQLP